MSILDCFKKTACVIFVVVKKKILFLQLIFTIFFLSACSAPWNTKPFSAVRITAIPKATVFIDGKEKGKTPCCNENIAAGEHDIRLVADTSTFSSWQAKVKFSPQIMTVINRILGPSDILSSGETIIMEPLSDRKNSELAIVSNPDSATVVIDNQDAGLTPFAQKNTSVGEHEVKISFPNHSQRVIKIKTKEGYRLVINVQLAQILTQEIGNNTESSQSATSSSTQEAVPTVSDRPERPRVKIQETPTGWLRVRTGPNVSGSEIGKVYPGEYYAYLDEQAGWVKIQFSKEQEGWVSVQYVEKEL
jgi:hypothetical protein